MTDARLCPCCGATMTELPLEAIQYMPMTPMERSIFLALLNAHPRPLTRRQIAEQVYALDPNGGPLSAENAISVHLHHMRPRMRKFGWEASGRRGHSSVALQPFATMVKEDLRMQGRS